MMDPDRWKQIENWFHEALEQHDPASREMLLSRIEDVDIRREVAALLAGEATPSPLDHRSSMLDAGDPPSLQHVKPGARLGPYQIEESIGSGGMGEVFRATDTRLHRKVAVKVCQERFNSRFRREAVAIAALNHPNVCTLYDVGPDYLVMELVEGQTLADRLRRGPIPVDQVTQFALQIAEALEAAHEQGIIHRDLKPANIKLTLDGKVKVLDFGLAKMQPRGSDPLSSEDGTLPAQSSTEVGLIVGTACYMSPEQAEGLPVDKRTDIWSFGVVLWEMLTGRRLFDAPTVSRILADVLHREIDFTELPANIPASLRTLIRRCLDRDPKKRLRDIGEVRLTLDPLAPQQTEITIQSRRPLIWMTGSATVLALLLCGVAYLHVRQGSELARYRRPPQRFKYQFEAPPEPFGNMNASWDGRFVVIHTLPGGTKQKLWVRALDSLQTKPLAEFEASAGLQACWSWDSEQLAVFVDHKLFRIPLKEGKPTPIADVPFRVHGAAWMDESTMLLGSRDGLMRLSLSTGKYSKLYDRHAMAPTPLPDGRFTFARPDGLYVGWLDGRTPVRIISDPMEGFNSRFIPAPGSRSAGHLSFVRNRVHLVQAFNLDKLEFSGQPFQVTEPVPGTVSTISTTGLLLTRAGGLTRRLAWFDRRGKLIEHASQPFRSIPNPWIRLSSDDTRAILPVVDDDRALDLWIADLRRGARTRFTFGGSGFIGTWSPDGKQILWGAPDGSRYIRAADGSSREELLYKDELCPNCWIYQWSPEGRFVLTQTILDRNKPGAALFRIPMSGDRKPVLHSKPPPDEFWPQVSPDGRWMAFVEIREGQKAQVVVESFPSGSGRWQVSTDGGGWPIWRSDGKELYYVNQSSLMAVPVRVSATSVEFGTHQQLFEFDAQPLRFQVSRDGLRFLIAAPAEDTNESRMITVDTDWRARLPKQP